MNKPKLYSVYLFLMIFSGVCCAQNPANGWLAKNIHGPSQIGIVDTIPVDVNNDGLMDVVSVSIEDGHLRAYINQGLSQDLVKLKFNQLMISDQVPGIYRVSATDINNDGRTDFLASSIETHEVYVLVAVNDGYRKQIIASDILLPTDAQAGDFNNDGLMDVISISFELNAVFIHFQNQKGQFSTAQIGESISRPRKLSVEYLDQNQSMDFLVASSGDSSIRLFANSGQGEFSEQIISNQMTGVRYLASCDIDGNELIDFVVSATDNNAVYGFTNLDNGLFAEQLIDDDIPGANALHCSDIDGDFQHEIIGIASQIGVIYTQEINGSDYQVIANSRDGYVSVYAASFEIDGEVQVLSQAYFENRNLIHEPNQPNQETVVWEDFIDGVSAVVTGDINNDLYEDYVVSGFRDGRIYWIDGYSFKRHTVAENIDGASDVAVVDLDQDGYLDVVSSASFGNKFYWHKNSANNLFTNHVILDGARFANAVEIGDIDGDNKPDVIGSSGVDDSVRWFKYSKQGFTVHLINQTNDAPNDVKAKDLDNDGDLDLVVPNFFSNDVSIYINNQPGFDEQIISSAVTRPYSVTFNPGANANFDDIIVSVSGDEKLIYLINQSDNVFVESTLFEGLPNPRRMVGFSQSEELLVTSPDNNAIYALSPINNMPTEQPIIERYIGVSSLVKGVEDDEVISGSIVSGLLVKLKKDLIFSTGFD